ncbi:MAG TPA: HIT domain-containing protein [Myxococcota bacterium]|nr:HIT domain-containing protein [Myxococcota bacterium]
MLGPGPSSRRSGSDESELIAPSILARARSRGANEARLSSACWRSKTHLLVIPREHLASTLDVSPRTHALVGELVEVAARLAGERGFAEDGYRLVFNTNAAAGRTLFHLHLHLLGGRSCGWPPG